MYVHAPSTALVEVPKNHAQKCCMTFSIGFRQTGQLSPFAFTTRAHSKQHAICPVSPCTNVQFRGFERQITQLWSSPATLFMQRKDSSVAMASFFILPLQCTHSSSSPSPFLLPESPFSFASGQGGADGLIIVGAGMAAEVVLSMATPCRRSMGAGGSAFRHWLTHPSLLLRRSRGTFRFAGWLENLFSSTSREVPGGCIQSMGEVSSGLDRTTAPLGCTTSYLRGLGRGTSCATRPRCPDSGFKASLTHPSSRRSLARPCRFTRRSLASNMEWTSIVLQYADVSSSPSRTTAPVGHTTL
mmetsp:Transcript_7848/g.11961  ORF Transcript_7848/g.11961 Transcript_7848/m.11961 type:complete len:300 (-) Transcript_7848:434-1333(-)